MSNSLVTSSRCGRESTRSSDLCRAKDKIGQRVNRLGTSVETYHILLDDHVGFYVLYDLSLGQTLFVGHVFRSGLRRTFAWPLLYNLWLLIPRFLVNCSSSSTCSSNPSSSLPWAFSLMHLISSLHWVLNVQLRLVVGLPPPATRSGCKTSSIRYVCYAVLWAQTYGV